RVLLLGSGGREHALARALAADSGVSDLHASPGNPGIGSLATLHGGDLADLGWATDLARSLAPGLVIVGPEAPLVAGLGDALREAGGGGRVGARPGGPPERGAKARRQGGSWGRRGPGPPSHGPAAPPARPRPRWPRSAPRTW